ncbi:MAG: response regulator transcription factor [Candidatus Eremiobacteraeota bacterium]|nr:response regulator transcription factor [Candidatus Eremiobacteraeota bacterium]MCW5871315.1 response regulator transcription factor [Candidatus Eremiobacteraeota bacterium]
MEPIRVIVVDDHSVVRMGLRTVLADNTDMKLVAEGETGAQACELVEKYKPDVLLIDLTLPDGNGLEVIREIRRQSPATQVLVLTMHDNELFLIDALVAGAAGYLLKDSPPKLIPLSIHTLFQGGCLLEKRLLSRLVRLVSQGRRMPGEEEATTPASASNLSERELAVLRLISKGSSNRVIGEKLHLAEATVKKYVHSLKSKLSVSDRAEAAVVGMRLGLLE